jgi:hypothetical protein
MRVELFESIILNRQFHIKVEKKKGRRTGKYNKNKINKYDNKEMDKNGGNGNEEIDKRANLVEEVEVAPPIWIILSITDGN